MKRAPQERSVAIVSQNWSFRHHRLKGLMLKKEAEKKSAKDRTRSTKANEVGAMIESPVLYRVPQPIVGESVGSWFMRTAIRLDLTYKDVEKFFGYSKGVDADFDLGYLPLTEIARRSRIGVKTIDQLICAHRSALHLFDLQSTRILHARGRPVYRICSACLNEQRIPFWEVRRRFVFEKDCLRHSKFNLPLLFVSDLIDNDVRSLANFRTRQYLRSPSEFMQNSSQIRVGFSPEFEMGARSFLARGGRDATLLAATAGVFFPPEWEAGVGEKIAYFAKTLKNCTSETVDMRVSDVRRP